MGKIEYEGYFELSVQEDIDKFGLGEFTHVVLPIKFDGFVVRGQLDGEMAGKDVAEEERRGWTCWWNVTVFIKQSLVSVVRWVVTDNTDHPIFSYSDIQFVDFV